LLLWITRMWKAWSWETLMLRVAGARKTRSREARSREALMLRVARTRETWSRETLLLRIAGTREANPTFVRHFFALPLFHFRGFLPFRGTIAFFTHVNPPIFLYRGYMSNRETRPANSCSGPRLVPVGGNRDKRSGIHSHRTSRRSPWLYASIPSEERQQELPGAKCAKHYRRFCRGQKYKG
jgi:hypothetical protein